MVTITLACRLGEGYVGTGLGLVPILKYKVWGTCMSFQRERERERERERGDKSPGASCTATLAKQ